MKKDHTSLLCDLGEISGVFADATSLETFLQRIVDMISTHMHCEVCSIYLYYDDSQELVLRATKGLKSDAIGRVRLRLGEGLTGQSLRELRPICVREASKSPGYRYFPGIGEEAYESFCAVPIVRGQTRIGAMVIQNAKKNFFTDEDIQVFRAITSQLANTIETAKLLISLDEKKNLQSAVREVKELKFIKGKTGADGFAFGEASVAYRQKGCLRPLAHVAVLRYSLEDFRRAVANTEKQLERLQKEIEEKLSDVAALIFTAQILMLKDKAFIEKIEAKIQQGINAPEAVISVVDDYALRFEGLASEYLKEKKQDILDIGNRLLENLIGPVQSQVDYVNKIVVAQELYPSDLLKLSSQQVAGIVLLSGGISSHVSILARSLGIPAIITDVIHLLFLPSGTRILLDAEQGNIYINPPDDVLAAFRQKEADKKRAGEFRQIVQDTTATQDGVRVKLLANINLLGDLKTAAACKSEGVGLYRTEFPFIVRSNFPTEEEQYVVYKKLVDAMRGKEIVFRTLDIGGDKVLSYYDYGKEENPFLGMRSIRFSLRHKDIFSQQLRAILRAGVGADLRIMFPMISSLDEFLEAKAVLGECKRALEKEKIPHHKHPLVGMMVELPAVMEIIDDLAQEVDFFSIGTNDFIQYMLAVDRTNEKVADLYLPQHPAILRALKRIVDAANARQKDISICGDMAHNEKYVPYFLGIGIRKISIDPHYHPRIQKAIGQTTLADAQKATLQLLSRPKISDIDRMISV